jgi:hypothetical protein
MMKKYHWTTELYFAGEFILHIFPLIVVLFLWRYELYEKSSISMSSGFYSLILNFLWPMVSYGSYELNDAYVYMTRTQWKYIWMICFMGHFLIPILSSSDVLSSPNDFLKIH